MRQWRFDFGFPRQQIFPFLAKPRDENQGSRRFARAGGHPDQKSTICRGGRTSLSSARSSRKTVERQSLAPQLFHQPRNEDAREMIHRNYRRCLGRSWQVMSFCTGSWYGWAQVRFCFDVLSHVAMRHVVLRAVICQNTKSE